MTRKTVIVCDMSDMNLKKSSTQKTHRSNNLLLAEEDLSRY